MKNYLLAILAGLLLVGSVPTMFSGWMAPSFGPLGWVALVPLFVVIADAAPRRAFLLSAVTGLVSAAGIIYWVYHAIHVFGKIDPGISFVVTLLLVLEITFFFALIPMLARWIHTRWRGEMIVLMPVIWTAIFFVRSYFPFNGFPWVNIAMSQWQALIPIQICDIAGVYGLVFVMVWVNWCFAELVLALRGRASSFLAAKVGLTVVMIAAVMVYGVVRTGQIEKQMDASAVVSVGLVQGNIPQDQKWQATKAQYNLDVHRELTKELFDSGVDLIVWPEASFSRYVSDKVVSADPRVFGLPPESLGKLPAVLFGVIVRGEGDQAWNSALLFDAKGELLGRYDKSHLVPFGEYVPMKNILFFARKITSTVGSFEVGTRFDPLVFPKGKLAPLICYEDVFPDISRKLVARGADMLVTITNDAWYGWSSAAFQHLALNVFRSVETRRYTVRAANTGVSAIISPVGSVLMSSPIFERLVMVGVVHPMTMKTLYVKYGDWFPYACIAYTLIGLFFGVVATVRKKKRIERENSEIGEIRKSKK